ncbi:MULTISPECIES: DNA polymerase [unclassified Microbacterium]|uniref:DNA polymerase n=1 Tax=unclassified Microbacterium TaxID=2609290 RepID=UPI00109BF88A|nr:MULTISPECIES: DNA polymerase [unclassified Microbacterium]
MRYLTPASGTDFTRWVASAPKPLVGYLRGHELIIAGEWTIELRDHGDFLERLWSRELPDHRLWTRTATVTELIKRSGVPGWMWVRNATTPWLVHHSVKGAEPTGTAQAMLTTARADPGAGRYAIEASRFEAVLANSTARGIRVDVERLNAAVDEMANVRRQVKDLMTFDPLDRANEDAVVRWLGERGVQVDGPASDDWGGRQVENNSAALAVAELYENILHIRRRLPKARELRAATRRGKVHTTLAPFAQVSGRVSSKGPALNNVAKDMRPLLLARPGHVLVTADYDGVEPRVLAALSGDEVLAHDLANGDPYVSAAERAGFDGLAFRKTFKLIIISTMYGATVGRTARMLGCSTAEARAVRDALWKPYPVAKGWLDAQRGMERVRLESGRMLGIVESAHARANLLIQSTAYDLFQKSALDVHDNLPKGAHIWLPMHDELIIETPEREVDAVMEVLGRFMPTRCGDVTINASPVVLGPHWRAL